MQATLRMVRASLLRKPWAMGAAVALGAFAVLLAAKRDAPVHPDTARDLLQAAACAHGNDEHCRRGSAASMFGLVHGALWPRFLALGYRLGASLPAMELAVLAFTAMGAALIAITARRYTGRRSVLPASAAFVLLSLWMAEAPIFWNPSLLPLPLALFAWALLEHAREGRATTALVSSFALAACIDLHVVCLVLLPLLLTVTTASANRPLLSPLLVSLGLGITLAVVSPATWADNLASLTRHGRIWLVACLPPIAIALGLAARSRWRKLVPARRIAVLIAILLAWSVVPHATGRLSPRYFAVNLPAIGLGFGWLFGRGFTDASIRFRKVLVALVTLPVLVRAVGPLERHFGWTLSDISRLASAVEERGVGSKAAFTRIEGLSMDELSTLVASSKPVAHAAASNLLVAYTVRSELPSPIPNEWSLVDLKANKVAVLRPLSPFLHRDRMRLCVGAISAEAECLSVTYRPDPAKLDYPPFSELPQALWQFFRATPSPFLVRMWLDLDTGSPGASHLIEIIDSDPGWHIEAVDGVAYRGELPSRRIVVEAASGQGRLALIHRYEAGEQPAPYWPPVIVETLPEEVALRALLVSADSTHARDGDHL